MRAFSTMSLTLTDVENLVKLAQIKLDDEQKTKTLGQLNGIFALVEQMRAVDTTGVEPLESPDRRVSARRGPAFARRRGDRAEPP